MIERHHILIAVVMYVESVANRNSPPCILLRESFRQVRKIRERFGLRRVVLVGDRAMITEARIRQDLRGIDGLDWITALRAPATRELLAEGSLQPSLFDERDQAKMAAEAALDGSYVVRSSLAKGAMEPAQLVGAYKGLAKVERAFRRLKTVDLHVRPIHHHLPDRVRAHVLGCMLAYYVEWHMRQAWAPILFDDDAPSPGAARRESPEAAAKRSPRAERKAARKRTQQDEPVDSFQTLLADLATIAKSRIQANLPGAEPFEKITRPTALQQRALSLLDMPL